MSKSKFKWSAARLARKSLRQKRLAARRRRALWRALYPVICATAVIGLNVHTAAADLVGTIAITSPDREWSSFYAVDLPVPGTFINPDLLESDVLDLTATVSNVVAGGTPGLILDGTIAGADETVNLIGTTPFTAPIITLGGSTRGFDLPSFCVLAFACLGVWLFLQRRANRKRRPVVTEIIAKDRALLFLRPLSDSIAPIPGGRR